MDTANSDEGITRRARTLRVHFLAFAAVSIILFAIDLVLFETLWFYWPVMAWGAVFGAHGLYCKSLSVDDDWAERRSNMIRDKSYDIKHIHDIEVSYEKKQAAEESAVEERNST